MVAEYMKRLLEIGQSEGYTHAEAFAEQLNTLNPEHRIQVIHEIGRLLAIDIQQPSINQDVNLPKLDL
jgi:hypothetical protein